MNKTLPFLVVCMLIFASNLSAQPWIYHGLKNDTLLNKSEENLNFYDIQKAFNAYWKNREVEKGKGYKPFRRWEYFMQQRIDTNGQLNNQAYWNALMNKQNKANDIDWTLLGPSKTPLKNGTQRVAGSGRLNCITFHPTNPNILYVGSPSGGFWKSTNGGESWATTTDKLGSLGVSDIVINPNNTDELFIVTGDGDAGDTYGIGVLKSADGGETWQTTSLTTQQSNNIFFRRILMDPVNPDTMIATSNNGIYRTTDGWASHSMVQNGNFRDLEFNPGNSAIVYATTYNYSGNAKVYKSVNNGAGFSQSVSGMTLSNNANRIELAVTKANNNKVYALVSDASNNGFHSLYVSNNSAESWTKAYTGNLNLLGWSANGTDEGGQGFYDLSLAVSPSNDDDVFVGGVNIWKSTDGGDDWNLSAHWTYNTTKAYAHADHHMLAYSPLTNYLYSANDGGLYVSTNGGQNWESISNGLEITQFYRLGTSATVPNKVIGGTQDNGTLLNNNNTWNEVLGGDGMEAIISHEDDNIMFAEVYYGDIYRSLNGGNNFVNIKPSDNPRGAWVTPYAMHPANGNILIAGYDNVYMTNNKGDSWEKISNNLNTAVSEPGFTLKNVLFAPSNPKIIYVASDFNIWKTNNNGENWQNINNNLPFGNRITSIAASHSNPSKIWVSISSYSETNKVYYSKNGGVSWNNYSDGLPAIPINALVFRKNSNNEIFAGTDIGVYHRTDEMENWEDFTGDLPNVIISELEINYATNRLYAATYGRGIWHCNLPELKKLTAGFNSPTLSACLDSDVKLIYDGGVAYDSLVWEVDGGNITTIIGDTTTVTWNATGLKTIGLTHYKDGVASEEIKYDYVNVGITLDFDVSPSSSISLCSSTSVNLSVTEGYNYSWSPTTGLNKTTGAEVVCTPNESTVYTVTGTQGSCQGSKEISVIVTQDDICNAALLGTGKHGVFSNSCASVQLNEPVPPKKTDCSPANEMCCNRQDTWCDGEVRLDNTVWFRTVVPAEGSISVWTLGLDTQIALYRASSCSNLLTGNYTLLAANDDYTGRDDYSSVIEPITGLTPGETLWIQVDGSYGGVTGPFYLYIYPDDTKVSTADRVVPTISSLVYPNPSDGSFTVELKLPDASKVLVEIFNFSGQLVDKLYIDEKIHRMKENIEISDSKGVHFVVISTDKQRITRKIIID